NQSSSLSQISRTNFFTLNNNTTQSHNHATNAGGNFLYNHRFLRPGRNFTTHVSIDFSDNNSDRFTNGSYHNIDSTQSPLRIKDTTQIQAIDNLSRNYRTNVRFSYMEPLNASGKTALEFNYEWNKSITESLRDVMDFMDLQDNTGHYNERQSNHYNYQFTTNRAGISLRGHSEKYNYNIGMQSQPTSLTGQSVDKQYTTNYQNINWVPSMRFVYNFSRNNSLTASLEGSANEPRFNQLQPVADSSNLNNIIVGNPKLQNEYTNTLSVRYNRYNGKKGNSLFVNFSYNKTSDKIVSSQLYNLSGTGRTTSYTNTDGFFGYHANGSYTNPFSNRQFVPGINFSANYDNNISFTNGLKNKGNNWNIRSGASFRLDLEDL
ncbi:MAG TPA: outer membrane beta-barrel protein, partial [Flavisolibacter sp.]|nr:outer membrane beta-barrel protein [Flavisolibacter sp.]